VRESILMLMQEWGERDAVPQLRSQLAAERAERARLERELDLRNSALDSATTHFMILDVRQPRSTIVYANRAIAADHGYEPAELLGRSPAVLVPPKENVAAFERIEQAMRDGQRTSTELLARRKDGSTFRVGMVMAPVRNVMGAVTHYVGIGADITGRLAEERAQRELHDQLYREMQERERMAIELRLAQKLESVGRLAAGIAHEINTPIQYVGDSVCFLQSARADLQRLRFLYRENFRRLAEGEPLPSILACVEEAEKNCDLEFLDVEMPKAFERTLEGIERVASIVRAMKEFAHPDSAEHSCADLNHAIETTLTISRNEYKYSAQVETRLGELPPVMCNVGELNQVFLNLIVNAAQAIGESGKDATSGRITVATAVAGDHVVISVEDNGCGIPEQNLEKIFDPFFTTKPVGRGTGQGLAIARAIVVEKHGGNINVERVSGGGTRFIIRLPVGGRASSRAA
jgi:PAS domain S-box-containing protein